MSRAEALACVPVKSPAVSEDILDSGAVRITYPASVSNFMAGLMRTFGGRADRIPPRKLELDELGTAVWTLIDGNRTVMEIVEAFARKYRLQKREAEVSVTQFLRELGRRGLIGLKNG